ncbi:UNVERIFIED_CONTAM: hypothetical protein Sangu_0152800 [Sesamum angustifolium]|uniref:Remorin C-terminal domain-containing protein n=1 Tax=Sesamum angustifolium TaxID=2727405 RepID=A0AAW2RKU2_9LAMI
MKRNSGVYTSPGRQMEELCLPNGTMQRDGLLARFQLILLPSLRLRLLNLRDAPNPRVALWASRACVLGPDGLSIHYDAGKSNSSCAKDNITQSTSVPGMSDLLDETAIPSSQDDKLDSSKEEETVVYRRDMATQMSPEGSTHSSSKGRLSFSTLPSSVPALFHPHSNHAAKDEIRDVQVDKGTTMARQSKKQGIKKMKKDSANVDYLPLPWNASEASKNASRLQREEAKITAWENLQKAKAEAAIRKLEMKLEKERSASMDKILNKLRAAEMKARAMRDSLSENQQPRARRTSYMGFSCCIYVKAYHLSNCFLARRK